MIKRCTGTLVALCIYSISGLNAQNITVKNDCFRTDFSKIVLVAASNPSLHSKGNAILPNSTERMVIFYISIFKCRPSSARV